MTDKDLGASPSGSGCHPIGAEPVVSGKAGIPNATVSNTICKPFSVYGMSVSPCQIATAINMLANLPNTFIAMDLVPAVLPSGTFHQKQEALNRLFQRWRKLGLVKFKRGRWSLTRRAWDEMQTAADHARREASNG